MARHHTSRSKNRSTTRRPAQSRAGSEAAQPGVGAKRPRSAPRVWRVDRLVRVFFVALTLTILAGLAYIPASDFLRLQRELDQVEQEADELQAALEQAERQQQLAESQNAARARCFGYWVEPGTESYLVQVGNGCAK